ncbi:MAG: hypothetical protein KDA22_11665, partial [Phycisphaerales bacterium]|nr:hypothetical protein [Phycisphaerales bacterium]
MSGGLALAASVALALVAGCVSRQGANPLRLDGSASTETSVAVDWPARRSQATDGADEARALALLDPGDAYLEAIAPPPQHYPDEREVVGDFGVGTIERVDLEAVATDSARLERARRRNGLSEWLLFVSERTSIRPVSSLPIKQPVPIRLPAWLRLIEPSITSLVIFEPEGPPRGIAIHLASLAGYVSY